MKKSIIIFALTLLVISQVYPEIVANLPELGKPTELRMNGGYMFIADQYSVLVYDLKTFAKVKKLGRKGEGPGEFIKPPMIEFTREKLVLSDAYKIVLFSRNLQYLKEIRLGSFTGRTLPVGDCFVIDDYKRIDKVEYRVFSLLAEKGQTIKNLVKEPLSSQSRKYLLIPIPKARSWKDMVFVAQPLNGFYIDVFDKHGKKLYQIKKVVKQIKAEEKHRLYRLDEILFAVGRSRFEQVKNRGVFNKPMMEYVPAINNFWVINDKIYVKTYDITDTKEKYIIMDLNGKIQREVFLPIVFKEILTFHNNTFYYLEDNEEKGCWVLHAVRF